MTTPARQSGSFPTVANIHKGTPKRKMVKNGNNIEIMGLDLKNKFRINFLPGTAGARESWHALHEKEYVKYPTDKFVIPDGYEVEVLHARIPSASVWHSWDWANETYDASGMKMAKADADHYIMRKDPLTYETVVKDGQPYEKFNVGDALTYERNGKKYALSMKSTGRLKLFLPELGQAVSFLLKTNSYIDSLYINEHLAAIQNVAEWLNGGVAGGIPIDIYRVERDSPWQKDGQSHKGKQWFIQIEANKEWIRSAIERMNKYALGETVVGMLKPVNVNTDNLPESAYVEADDETDPGTVQPENVIDGTATDSEPSMTYEQAKETFNVPAQKTEEKPAAPATTKPERPLAAETLRSLIARKVEKYNTQKVIVSQADRQIVAKNLDMTFEGQSTPRYELCKWLVGVSSTNDMTQAQVKALQDWLECKAFDSIPPEYALKEARMAHSAALKDAGQLELPA